MPLALKHEEQFNRGKVRLLSLLSFFLGFLDAFLLYILSSYFLRVAGEGHISSFYLAAFLLVLWFLMWLQPLVNRFGSVRLLLTLLFGLIVSGTVISLGEPSWLGAIVLVLYLVCNNLVWSVMDVLVEDFSADRVSGRVRGFYLTILNLGLLLAPFLSTGTLDRFGYPGVFLVLALGYMLVFLVALIGLRHHRTAALPSIRFRTTIRRALAHKNIRIIYGLSWMLEFFYVIMIIYAPLLLLGQGFTWRDIGIVFTVMLIPFVVVQYPLGVIADRKWGERELLFGALLVLGAATLTFAFLDTSLLWVWGAVLFATRLGAAALEVLRDSYFYKQIGPTDTDMVALFRTARPVANIIGAGVSVILLAFFGTASLFVVVGGAAILLSAAALSLDDTDPVPAESLVETGELAV